MELNVIIIDDEETSRLVIRKLLEKFCLSVNIIGEASNPNEAYDLITEKKPDLVLLDIQMPEGNGFSLLRRFENIFFDIIFITSYDQYAIKAIRYSVIDYLLKPVETNDLINAIAKAEQRKKEKNGNLNEVVNVLIDNEFQKEKIALHINNKVRIIKLSEIKHIEASSQYSNFYLSDNIKISSTKTLKELEELFTEVPDLIRINKSCIINTMYIESYSKSEPYIIVLSDNSEHEISRRKRNEVLERLKLKR